MVMSLGEISKQWVSEQAGEQAQVTYLDHKKIKGFEDVGYLLEAYVVSGGDVTPNIQRNDLIDVTDVSVSLNNDMMAREGTSFQTKIPSTVYYLDFSKDGDWTWSTSHPTGTVGADYLTIAVVTTDTNGMVDVITDARTNYGSVRFKSPIAGYATDVQLGEVNAQLAETPSGVINAVLKYGADPTGVIDSSTALQNAIDETQSGTEIRTVYLPSGVYKFSTPLVSRGGIKIKGDGNNNGSTILRWVGEDTGPVLEFHNTDGGIIYRIVLEDITVDGGTGDKPQGIRLRNVSELEISRVFVKTCTDAFVFDSAAIIYMDRIDTSGCDRVFNFETSSASPLFNNSFITLSRLNIWDTSEAIFNFKSGFVNNLEISESWFENFQNFVKNENDGAQTTGFNHFNLSTSKISNTVSSPYSNAKFVKIAAKNGNFSSQFFNFSARECVIEVNSSDYIMTFNTNGNTGVSSLIGYEFIFTNCLLFGAPTAVSWSDSTSSRLRFIGSTIAQTAYYSGVAIPFFSGAVRPLDTPNLLGYTPVWTASSVAPVLGNGTLVGRYIIRGGLCRLQLELTIGSTTTAGTGSYTFSLPIAHGTGYGISVGTSYILDAGTMNYTGVAHIAAGASVMSIALNNVASFVGATNPITWATGDKITIAIEYPVSQ